MCVRNDSERGASAVEFAILLPLFLVLVMGLISSGIAFGRGSALSHSAREGARFGATYAIVGGSNVPDAWLTAVSDRAVSSSAGHLASGVDGRYTCVAYIGYEPRQFSTTDWTRKRVESGSSVSYSNGSVNSESSWCYDDGRARSGDERRVQVVVGMRTSFNVVFWSRTFQQTDDSVARFEAVAAR